MFTSETLSINGKFFVWLKMKVDMRILVNLLECIGGLRGNKKRSRKCWSWVMCIKIFLIFNLYDCLPINKSVEGEVGLGNFAATTCTLQWWQATSHIRRIHSQKEKEKYVVFVFRGNSMFIVVTESDSTDTPTAHIRMGLCAFRVWICFEDFTFIRNNFQQGVIPQVPFITENEVHCACSANYWDCKPLGQ